MVRQHEVGICMAGGKASEFGNGGVAGTTQRSGKTAVGIEMPEPTIIMLTYSLLETYKAVAVINTDYNDFVCILRQVSSMSSLSWGRFECQPGSLPDQQAVSVTSSSGGPAVAFLCIVCT
jgi:hypothetical protein